MDINKNIILYNKFLNIIKKVDTAYYHILKKNHNVVMGMFDSLDNKQQAMLLALFPLNIDKGYRAELVERITKAMEKIKK